MNLKVWIDHYLWQGVDHIYLIDNGSTDTSLEIIDELQKQNYPITLYNLTERYAQIKHQKTVYDKECLKEKTKWLIIADLDEFFYCHNSKLNVMLKNYEDVIVIYSNWRLFGSNGLVKHPADIRQAITNREPHEHHNTKYIFQTKQIDSCNLSIHDITNRDNLKTATLSDIFRLNHYVIQSKEYYATVKMTRGDADNPNLDHFRDWNYFHRNAIHTKYEDND